MADLAARNEVRLLAHDLGAPDADLVFLADADAGALRELRGVVSAAVFAAQEPRFRRIAGLTNVLPAAMTAKIAQVAFGPMISGRIAGVLDTADAVRLARHMSTGFLTDLAPALDPARVAGIVQVLPQPVVVGVGKGLLARGEHLVLGRFVAVAPLAAALEVAEGETPEDLLKVAVFCEDQSALADLVAHFDDDVLGAIVRTALEGDALDDALTLLAVLPPEQGARIIDHAVALEPTARDALLEEIAARDAWDLVRPTLPFVGPAAQQVLAGVDAL